jgi:hypothetical protein
MKFGDIDKEIQQTSNLVSGLGGSSSNPNNMDLDKETLDNLSRVVEEGIVRIRQDLGLRH